MKKLETFYHLYCPPTPDSAYIGWWIDQQLGSVVKSRLHDHSKITISITMPKLFTELRQGVPLKDNTFCNYTTFEQKIVEYIQFRYPFCHFAPIRDTSEPNIYEGSTLKLIHDLSKVKDCYILYFHNKGMVSNSFQVQTWREVLNHHLIERWRDCCKLLEDGADIVGVKDMFLPTSGNFFWTDNCYIQNLHDPLESQLYVPEEKSSMWPGNPAYRYCFELWPLSGKPVVSTIHETNTCHFSYYYLNEWGK
jgi:hypothetical protein